MPPKTSAAAPARVTTFPLNRKHLTASAVCGVLMVLSSRREFVQPGSPLHDYALAPLARRAPSVVGSLANVEAAAAAVQNWMFRILVGLHALEVPLFAALRLRPHGVPFLSGLWFKWTAAVFFAGGFTWELFAGAVKAAEAKGM